MLFTFYVDPSFLFTLWPPLWLQLCSVSIHLIPNILYAPTYFLTRNIPNILCKLKIQYHVQKSMPLVPYLRHMNSVQTPTPNFYAFNIHFNTTLQFMPTDSSGLLLSGSPTKIHQCMYCNLKIHYMKRSWLLEVLDNLFHFLSE